MTIGIGHQARIGVGIQADYNTAATIDELVSFTSEDLTQTFEEVQSEILHGNAGRLYATRMGKRVSGGISVEGIYDTTTGDPYGIETVLLSCMGTGTRDAVNGYNQYTLKDLLDTYLTIGVNKQVSLFEFVSTKCNGMTINVAENGLLTIDFTFIIKNRYKTGDGGITNSIATVTALSPAQPCHIRWQDGTFRIADIADALAAGDKTQIKSFTLTFNRNLDEGKHATEDNANHTDSDLIIEPQENGFREVTVDFETSRYSANTFNSFFDSDTKLQADYKFTDGTFEFNIYMPTLKILGNPIPVSDAGVLTESVSCQAFLKDSTQTFMKFTDGSTTVDDEFAIEIKSNRTAIPT